MSEVLNQRPRMIQLAAAIAVAAASMRGTVNVLRNTLRVPDTDRRAYANPAMPSYRRSGRRTAAQAKRQARKARNRLRARGHFRAAVR